MKILFGSIVVDARGRLNGHVFRKTQFGNSVTSLALPRSAFGNLINPQLQSMIWVLKQFKELTASDRELFRLFAAANPITNAFGVPRNIGARAMFQKLAFQNGFPQPLPAVAVSLGNEVASTRITGVYVDSATGFIHYTAQDFTGLVQLNFFVQGTNQGVNSPPANKWRRIPNAQVLNNGSFSLSYDIRQIPNVNLSGKKLWLRVRYVNTSGWGEAVDILELPVT